jgi:thioredoxin-related protein
MLNRRITRRRFIETGSMVATVMGMVPGLVPSVASAAASEPEMSEDGLHYQSWFMESFLELNEDIAGAADQDKHFAIIWELKGCPFCRETHRVNFANDKIRNFITTHFEVLQLNVIGSRPVTDFDGEEISEKQLASKYGIRFTPTIQFFPKSFSGIDAMAAKDREATRLAGYMPPDQFLSMFQYVAEQAYQKKTFQQYLKSAK